MLLRGYIGYEVLDVKSVCFCWNLSTAPHETPLTCILFGAAGMTGFKTYCQGSKHQEGIIAWGLFRIFLRRIVALNTRPYPSRIVWQQKWSSNSKAMILCSSFQFLTFPSIVGPNNESTAVGSFGDRAGYKQLAIQPGSCPMQYPCSKAAAGA